MSMVNLMKHLISEVSLADVFHIHFLKSGLSQIKTLGVLARTLVRREIYPENFSVWCLDFLPVSTFPLRVVGNM